MSQNLSYLGALAAEVKSSNIGPTSRGRKKLSYKREQELISIRKDFNTMIDELLDNTPDHGDHDPRVVIIPMIVGYWEGWLRAISYKTLPGSVIASVASLVHARLLEIIDGEDYFPNEGSRDASIMDDLCNNRGKRFGNMCWDGDMHAPESASESYDTDDSYPDRPGSLN